MLDGRPICVTGSRDATVKVWNIESGRLIHDLRGHATAVRCLEIAGNQIVSGSYDHTCRVSLTHSYRLELMFSSGRLIRGNAYMSCLDIRGRYMLSLSMAYGLLLVVPIRPSEFGPLVLGAYPPR